MISMTQRRRRAGAGAESEENIPSGSRLSPLTLETSDALLPPLGSHLR